MTAIAATAIHILLIFFFIYANYFKKSFDKIEGTHARNIQNTLGFFLTLSYLCIRYSRSKMK